jgi:Tfp pilus assembly protein PilO
MAASMKTWIAGTAGLCVIVLGLGGLVLVKPQLDEAGRLHEETAQLEMSNDALSAEVEILRTQFASIDQYRAELAKDRVKIPEDSDLPAMLREIDEQATKHGVTLVTSSPQEALSYTTSEEDESTAEPTAEATSDSGEPAPSPSASTATSTGSTADALASVLASVEGMFAIPVTIDVVGDYANVQQFIAGLQKDTQRYFLLGSFTMTRLETADANKLPATTAGQIEAVMEAAAFVLLPDGDTTIGDQDDPGSALPVDPGRNPFDNGVVATEG